MVFGRLGGAIVRFVMQLLQLGDLPYPESAKWISGSADILLVVKREFPVLLSVFGNFACHHALCVMRPQMLELTGNSKSSVTISGELVELVVVDAVYLNGDLFRFRRQKTTAEWLSATFLTVCVFCIIFITAMRRA